MSFNSNGVTLTSQFNLKSKQPLDGRYIITNKDEYEDLVDLALYPGLEFAVTNELTLTNSQKVAKGIYKVGVDGTTITKIADEKGQPIIKGSGAASVTTTNGVVTISSTDTKVTSVGNHYTPEADSQLSAAANSTTAATWNTTSLVTGVKLQRDSKGHVTDVTVDSVKMPAQPSYTDKDTTYALTSSQSAANGNVKINLKAGGSGSGINSITIKGNEATTVTTDASGNIIIDGDGTGAINNRITTLESLPIANGEGDNSLILNDTDNGVASGAYSIAEGVETRAIGEASHAEGYATQAGQRGFLIKEVNNNTYVLRSVDGLGENQICDLMVVESFRQWDGKITKINSETKTVTFNKSVIEADYLIVKEHPELGDIDIGSGAHAEGSETVASGCMSHAEGAGSYAAGDYSHAEGQAIACGATSHAEGFATANGEGSHAEGFATANGEGSHAEGAAETIGDYSHAGGYASIAASTGSFAHGGINDRESTNPNYAGTRGYYFKIDPTDTNYKTILLYKNQSRTIEADAPNWSNADIKNSKGEVISHGDRLSFVNDSKYINEGAVASVNGNQVTLRNPLPFTAQKDMGTKLDLDDYSVLNIDRPDEGPVDFGFNAVAFGEGNKAANLDTFVAGKDNIAAGHYGAVFGRENLGSYGSLIAGRGNTGSGDYAMLMGSNNKSTADLGFAMGNGSIAEGIGACFAFGQACKAGACGSAAIGSNVYTNTATSNGEDLQDDVSSVYRGQVVVGRYNANPGDNAFVVGAGGKDTTVNGEKVSHAFNALEVNGTATKIKAFNNFENFNTKTVLEANYSQTKINTPLTTTDKITAPSLQINGAASITGELSSTTRARLNNGLTVSNGTFNANNGATIAGTTNLTGALNVNSGATITGTTTLTGNLKIKEYGISYLSNHSNKDSDPASYGDSLAGQGSIAFGWSNNVNTYSSFAFGARNNVKSGYSGALGYLNNAHAKHNIIIGRELSSNPSVEEQIIIGNRNKKQGSNTADGLTQGASSAKIVIADNTVDVIEASKDITKINTKAAIGTGHTVTGNNALAIGNTNTITGVNALAVGQNSTAHGNHSFAGGNGCVTGYSNVTYSGNIPILTKATKGYASGGLAFGVNSFVGSTSATFNATGPIALGYGCSATNHGAIALGRNAHAKANGSAAIGYNVSTFNADISTGSAAGQIVVGKYNSVPKSTDVFIVGAGTASTPKNILTANSSQVTINGTLALTNGTTTTTLTQAELATLKAGGTGTSVDIVDNLTSTSTTSALSARQGSVLNTKFNNYATKANPTFTGTLTLGSETLTAAELTQLKNLLTIKAAEETSF